jgi:chorismate dehydratase
MSCWPDWRAPATRPRWSGLNRMSAAENTVAQPVARIGMINYINTAPLYEVWRRRKHPPSWRVVVAVPSELNRLLREGNIDLGFVSSHEYAVRPELYRILPDLSIAASGSVGSVFLFARREIDSLDDVPLLLTSQSQTSISLLKIILEEFYGVRPRYETGSIRAQLGELKRFTGILAIGDEALLLAQRREFSHVIDLGKVWHDQTALPFVFAVWAVRRDFIGHQPAELAAIQRELVHCLKEGLADLAGISAAVAPRIPMAVAECHKYLRGIEYDLGPAKREGLTLFYDYLIKRGEGASGALPLQFWSGGGNG